MVNHRKRTPLVMSFQRRGAQISESVYSGSTEPTLNPGSETKSSEFLISGFVSSQSVFASS